MGLSSDPDACHPDNEQRFELFESHGTRRADAARRLAGNRVVRLEFWQEFPTAFATPNHDPITRVGLIEPAQNLRARIDPPSCHPERNRGVSRTESKDVVFGGSSQVPELADAGI